MVHRQVKPQDIGNTTLTRSMVQRCLPKLCAVLADKCIRMAVLWQAICIPHPFSFPYVAAAPITPLPLEGSTI